MASYHRGRLIDHLSIVVSDLDASKRFYKAVLEVLNVPLGNESDDYLEADELYISRGPSPSGPIHLAFVARAREDVDRFYKTALAAGGRDNGAPGLRPEYHEDYYGAFVLDPDGNNIEVVFHGNETASAASILVTSEPK